MRLSLQKILELCFSGIERKENGEIETYSGSRLLRLCPFLMMGVEYDPWECYFYSSFEAWLDLSSETVTAHESAVHERRWGNV